MIKLGSVYNSNASIIYNIINWIGWIACAGCVAMILFALIKILTGDEQDHQRYLKRIRNGIIALVLILTSTTLVGLVTSYFTPNVNADTGIGSFNKYVGTRIISADNGKIAETSTDVDGRDVFYFNDRQDTLYVKTGTITIYASWSMFGSKPQLCFDVWKIRSECQGATRGALETPQYYVFVDRPGSWISEETRNKYRFYIFAYSDYEKVAGKIKEESDFVSFMDQYASPNSTYTKYSAETNPWGNASKVDTTQEALDYWYNNEATDEEKKEVEEKKDNLNSTIKTDFWNH